jgi:hypothetical protein
MRRLLVGLVAVLSLSLITAQLSVAAVTPGAKCSKVGATSIYNGKKYTCVKSGKKLVWNKGVATAKPVPVATDMPTLTPTQTVAPTKIATPSASATPTLDINSFVFSDICEKDPFIPTQWGGMENLLNPNGSECSWPYRIVKKEMSTSIPTSILNEKVQEISTCQLPEGPLKGAGVAWPMSRFDFWNAYERHPSLNTIIQIVPIFSPDAPDNGRNPGDDYKAYIDYLKEWVEHASDGKGKLTVRVPDRYVSFPEKIAEFNLTHERSQAVADKFRESIEKNIVPKFDLTGANVGIIVLPAGSNFSLTQQLGLNQSRIGSGYIKWSIFPPFTLTSRLGPGSNFIHPAWWLHELHHATVGFDDAENKTDKGLHMWGLMSYGANEMLGWQKWLVGLWGSERVSCASANAGGTYWIAPSTHQTSKKKLIVLRVSANEVIVLESMRAGGLNYKMPKWMEGVLVYGIDNSTVGQHTGTFVLKPEGRSILSPTLSGLSRKFINSDVAFKQGESTVYKGYKITVIESGDFGDVIKVEKV